jgi:C_GCAxxG_C_C family probable redox protein
MAGFNPNFEVYAQPRLIMKGDPYCIYRVEYHQGGKKMKEPGQGNIEETIGRIKKYFRNNEEEGLFRKYRSETVDEELLRRIERDALEFQIKYRGCAQEVLYALVTHLRPGGISDPWLVVPGLTGLCAGVASQQVGPCGALLGGLYAIGMEFGRKDFNEPGGPKEKGLDSNFFYCDFLCRELYNKFSKKFGSPICKDLLQKEFGSSFSLDDPNDPQFLKLVQDGILFDILSTNASRLVAGSAVLAAEIILRERKKRATQ